MKKIDLMNFFYSIGAVVILIGVIAKFLEWKSQDALLLAGLSVEALVFTFSSIQQKSSTVVYKWENIFPELITEANANLISDTQERYNFLMNKYISFLENSIASFEIVNNNTIKCNEDLLKITNENIKQLELNTVSITNLNAIVNIASQNINNFNLSDIHFQNLIQNIIIVDQNLKSMDQNINDTNIPLEELKGQFYELNNSLTSFNLIGKGILAQFKNLEI